MTIGSLYWDERPMRRQWRSERLDMEGAQSVGLPIRYGRLSTTRGSTYTMVFSPVLGGQPATMGAGKVVPCRQPRQGFDQILEEAERLWASESHRSPVAERTSDDWGCAALLVNPEVQQRRKLVDRWRGRISGRPGYGALSCADDEPGLVDESGVLGISWPRLTNGEAVELDILLAAVTEPKIIGGSYPDTGTIVDAWTNGNHHVTYFWNNRKHGIVTFQDREIEAQLVRSGAPRGY